MIVGGNVYTGEYEDRDGNRRSSLEIRATSVGPDLARCIVRIDKRRHPESTSADGGASSDGQVDADPEIADGEAELEEKGLPLTA